MLIQKNWSVGEILRRTWRINLIILGEVGIVVLGYHYFVQDDFVVPISVAAILGTAIAFFIGFTNNQAYDRWWEARKVWGMIVNDSRSWARSVLTYWDEGDPKHTETKHRMVRRHLAWLHCVKNHLRGLESTTYAVYLNADDREKVRDSKHQPNTILLMQSQDIHRGLKEKKLDPFAFKALDEALVRMTDQMGMCERIKNTVFPTSYVFFTKFFIFLFISLNAISIHAILGWWAILFGWIIGYVFYTTFYNGLTIMNPFENLPSDTPMSALTRTLERNLLEMLDEPDLPESLEPIHGEYLL
ncbi:bestrophin family protein [Phaeocystidibacter luteus]|uniref:Bestrophin n=1 Tax=Phaeocystidibacter luteus TaxID=911197 RepID=A0A6N6RK48_9FLAO|nr:bestrophin family ion channel [Phaeocystidibacter luteus]KAB2808701.1 hypothetical protein F8C67_10465 [Phaeocystidibacter luteus]